MLSLMTSSDRSFVVGVDYSDHSIVAVDEALRLAVAAPGTLVVPVLVLPGGPVTEPSEGVEMTSEVVRRSEENLVQLLEARARALGVRLPPIEPRVRFGAAAERLIAEAKELDAHLIAVGTHGRQGLSHLLVGSVADEVMRQAPCSVLVARSHAAARADASAAGGPRAAALRVAATPGLASSAEPDAEPGRVADTTVVTEPHIDAGRVVVHVLDAPSGQVFVCAFEDTSSVSVAPLEGDWVPAPSSEGRARAARTALGLAERELSTFAELFEELRRRRARGAK
jgi:universal stress protein A